jgi:hypothetical protein
MRRTMAIMVLLAVVSLYLSMFPLYHVSCLTASCRLSTESYDWTDKDPRTGILGLVYLGLGQEQST